MLHIFVYHDSHTYAEDFHLFSLAQFPDFFELAKQQRSPPLRLIDWRELDVKEGQARLQFNELQLLCERFIEQPTDNLTLIGRLRNFAFEHVRPRNWFLRSSCSTNEENADEERLRHDALSTIPYKPLSCIPRRLYDC